MSLLYYSRSRCDAVVCTIEQTELFDKFVRVWIRESRIYIARYLVGEQSARLFSIIEREARRHVYRRRMLPKITLLGLRSDSERLKMLILHLLKKIKKMKGMKK